MKDLKCFQLTNDQSSGNNSMLWSKLCPGHVYSIQVILSGHPHGTLEPLFWEMRLTPCCQSTSKHPNSFGNLFFDNFTYIRAHQCHCIIICAAIVFVTKLYQQQHRYDHMKAIRSDLYQTSRVSNIAISQSYCNSPFSDLTNDGGKNFIISALSALIRTITDPIIC